MSNTHTRARARTLLAATAAATTAVTGLAAPAQAGDSRPHGDRGDRVVLASSALPLQLAVGDDGTVYVAQSAAGVLTAVDRKDRVSTVATVTGPQAEIAGVDARGRGTVTFTSTTSTGSEGATEWLSGTLNRVRPNGRTRQLADLLAYERAANPDAQQSYGTNASAACLATLPAPVRAFLSPYTGIEDSHAYAVALLDDGSRVVADAGGNDLVRVASNGRVSTLAVRPPQPVTVTQEILDANELRDAACLVGATFLSEAVPTDVELGPDGWLYVTTLSGGIAPGAVWRVHPRTGQATRLSSGFAGAVNLAVGHDGTIYVSELQGGRIAALRDGTVTTVRQVVDPGGLEYADGRLYVGTDVFASGRVISFRL